MSIHVILTSPVDIPEGYSTYSVLLIPDPDWFNKVGLEVVYQFHFESKTAPNL